MLPSRMKSFDSVDRSAFRWLRLAEAPRAFQLLAGDDPVARLAWSAPHGSLATAETTGPPLTVKRDGFLSPHVLVRGADGEVLARLDLHFSASRLAVGPRRYLLRRRGFLVPAWQVESLQGEPFLHLETVAERGNLEGGVVAVQAPAQGSPDLLLLLLVSWYFIVQAWVEEEAASLSTAAVVATG